MSTGCPRAKPVTPSPHESTVPAPSEPNTCGRWTGTPGIPASVNRSSRLNAAARIRTRTSPGPGGGSGISTNSSRLRSPCSEKPNPRTDPSLRFGELPPRVVPAVLDQHAGALQLVPDAVGFGEVAAGAGTSACGQEERNDRRPRPGAGRLGPFEEPERLFRPPVGRREGLERFPGEMLEVGQEVRQGPRPAEQERDRLPGVEVVRQGRVQPFDELLGRAGQL